MSFIPEYKVRWFLLAGGLLIGVALLAYAFVNPSGFWGLEAGLGRLVLVTGAVAAFLVGILSWVTTRSQPTR